MARRAAACGRPSRRVLRTLLRTRPPLERVNWLGNVAPRGISESYGIMVNYLYDPEQCSPLNPTSRDDRGRAHLNARPMGILSAVGAIEDSARRLPATVIRATGRQRAPPLEFEPSDANATFALKAGVWARRVRLLIVSPDSTGTACPPPGRHSRRASGRLARETGSVGMSFGVRRGRRPVEVWLPPHWRDLQRRSLPRVDPAARCSPTWPRALSLLLNHEPAIIASGARSSAGRSVEKHTGKHRQARCERRSIRGSARCYRFPNSAITGGCRVAICCSLKMSPRISSTTATEMASDTANATPNAITSRAMTFMIMPRPCSSGIT
jgi:Malonyl-CoA decarboxylase C-terminal domain